VFGLNSGFGSGSEEPLDSFVSKSLDRHGYECNLYGYRRQPPDDAVRASRRPPRLRSPHRRRSHGVTRCMIECGCGEALKWQTAEAAAVFTFSALILKGVAPEFAAAAAVLIVWNIVKSAAGA
jgi:hypothetical protein